MTYKPLPNYLTIKQSKVHGLGLFATEDLPVGLHIGITHVKDDRFEDGYIRTPLGGFFNHSEQPNVKAMPKDDYIILVVLKDIKAGEELVANYWLYKIKSE
mgnify:CR=1 FL=1